MNAQPTRGGGQHSFDELGEPLREITFVVVDLETTGGSAQTEAITEIGAVKVRGGEVLGEFATLVDPGRCIPPQITMLTGITDAMVVRAPQIGAVLPAFLEFIRGTVLVAHNAGFDIGFLKAACRRLDLPWPKPAVVDTVHLARSVLSRDEAPSVRLGRARPAARLAGGAEPSRPHRRARHGRRPARAVRAGGRTGGAQPGASFGTWPATSPRRAGASAISPTACRRYRACTSSAGRTTRSCTSGPRATCASGSVRTSPRPRPAAGSSTW